MKMRRTLGPSGSWIWIWMTGAVISIQAAHHPQANFHEDYNYDVNSQRGPSAWQGQCNTGQNQSPIDLRYKDDGVRVKHTRFWFNKNYLQANRGFYFANKGHTFQVQLSSSISDPSSQMDISGLGLQHRYTFAQLHFHWGDRDEVGSEHTLQGERFPFEIHLVHYKSKYGNLSHALQGNGQDREAVMVLAVLAEIGHENRALSPIVDAAKLLHVRNPGTLMHSFKPLCIYDILPHSLNFVRYSGSLTTPDCLEKVVWTVLTCPIQVSRNQIEAFRRLRDTNGQTYYNYRPLQPRNGRVIKYYKTLDKDAQAGNTSYNKRLLSHAIGSAVKTMNSVFQNLLDLVDEMNMESREQKCDNRLRM